MSDCDNNPSTIRTLSSCYFDTGKLWWWIALGCKFVAFVLGITALWLPQGSVWFAVASAVVLFAAEACSMYSNSQRSIGEGLHRKLDFENSFGWPISALEIADVVATLPKRARKRLAAAKEPDSYFASTEPPGWKRAMQNLLESAWWSKHLARSMVKYCIAATIGLTSFSIVMLIASYSLFSSADPLASMSRVAVSVLLLIVSLGLIPLTVDYNTFVDKCKKAEDRAAKLLDSVGDNAKNQAIKAFHEYHLARATAPPIPTALWRRRRDHLNDTWNQFITRRQHA